ncbi:MAG: hypothetical protein OXF30_03325 [Candidatus Saccharibacteria bacterium]|nr:hypothetical protein [Candidatus Saccharibacteria bacterium]
MQTIICLLADDSEISLANPDWATGCKDSSGSSMISPQKNYIGLKIDKSVVLAVKIYKSKVDLQLFRVTPKDLRGFSKKVTYIKSSKERWGKHVSVYSICEGSEEEYSHATSLTSQLLSQFFS